MQKREADSLLDVAHLAAENRLWNGKNRRRTRKAAEVGDRYAVMEFLQVHGLLLSEISITERQNVRLAAPLGSS
jgi:hypothetical protein